MEYPAITSSSGGPPGCAAENGLSGRYTPVTVSVGLGGSELVKRSALAWFIASVPANSVGSVLRASQTACSSVMPEAALRSEATGLGAGTSSAACVSLSSG